MTSTDILILTLVGVLALAFLVFAGLALSVRSFTALTELIAKLGLQVVQQQREGQQVQTTLLENMVNGASSAKTADTPTTPAVVDATLPEHGDTTTQ